MSFSENSGKPKKLGTLIYGSQFRVLSGGSKWLSARPTGSAGTSFSENSEKPKKLGTLIYGSQFRVLSGGSKWLSALPTGSAAAGRHVFPEPRYSNGL